MHCHFKPQLIRHFGYTAEEHFVTTEDGYILTVHRIPVGRDGKLTHLSPEGHASQQNDRFLKSSKVGKSVGLLNHGWFTSIM